MFAKQNKAFRGGGRVAREEEVSPKAAFAKADSPHSRFAIMDSEGREMRYYNQGYWKKQPKEEIVGYSLWLIAVKHGPNTSNPIRSMSDFLQKAPRPVYQYIVDNGLQGTIGLPTHSVRSSKTRQITAAKLAKKKEREEAKAKAREEKLKADSAPPARGLYEAPKKTWTNPAQVRPPLPQPRFRLWKEVSGSEFSREAMIEEFFQAAKKGEIYHIEQFMAMGIPVDVRNGSKETALMLAAMWGRTKTCNALLEHGANPRARNAHNENVLSYAKDSEKEETVELIRKAAEKSLRAERKRRK